MLFRVTKNKGNMEKCVKQRLIQFIKYKKISQRNFEQRCGLANGYVGNIRNSVSGKKLDDICRVFPELNKSWLLLGEGDMLNNALYTRSNAEQFTPQRHTGIPLVGQYAHAGYLGGYADEAYMESLPTIDFTPDREMTGNWLAFEVKGESMDDGTRDSYEEGEIVICREVERNLWQHSRLHIDKRDFVIVHADGILLKRIIAHDVERHSITIHSLNPLFADRVLNLADVRQIFSVVESRKKRKRF